jgi:hypothetical protein
MVIKDFYKTRSDGVALYRTHSDRNEYLRKVGTDEDPYSEAIDIESAPYEYVETGDVIPEEERV